jgi:hypothetical protein
MDIREILRVALRWTMAWAVAGLVMGVSLMLMKAMPLAESGHQPDDVLSYAAWIPGMAIAGAAAGLGMGFLYASLMALTEEWRDSYEGSGTLSRLGPQVLCGAVAGLVAGVLMLDLGAVLFFAVLGACSAAALNWRAIRA